jgi:hypothetical protein
MPTSQVLPIPKDHISIRRTIDENTIPVLAQNSDKCTTTFIRYWCTKCDFLINFDQSDEQCEHKKKNLPGKCKIDIESKDEKMDSRECPECLEKAKKRAQGAV